MKQNAYMGSPITAHRYREHISRHELEIKCLRIKLHNLNILYVSIVLSDTKKIQNDAGRK